MGLTIAIIGGLGSMLGWGIADYFAKKTVDKVGELTTLFYCQFLGALPVVMYLLFYPAKLTTSLNTLVWIAFFALIDGIGYIYFYKALNKGKVSIISPVLSSFAALAVLISAFWFHEYISLRAWFILGVIFTGIILTSIDIKGLYDGNLNRKDISKGIPETIVAIILFALFYPFWDSFLNSGNWALLLLQLKLAISVLIFLAAKRAGEDIIPKNANFDVWKYLLLIGIFDGGAYVTLSWAFGLTTYTSITTMLSAAYPVPTLILARIFLKERLNKIQYVGVVTILVGIIALSSF